MAAGLAVLILAFAIPAWAPVMRNHELWLYLKQSKALAAALTLFTVSEILQLLFLGFVGTGTLTLDYFLAFARIGIPVCILALVIALVSGMKNAVGIGISSLLGVAAWSFSLRCISWPV